MSERRSSGAPEQAVAGAVLDGLDALTARMGENYRQVPEYAALSDEAMRTEVLPVSRKIVEEFFSAIVDRRTPDVDGLPELHVMGRRRLEMGVPLEPMLHVYRIAGRTVWDAMVEATPPGQETVLAPLGAAWMDYIDEAASAAAAAYLEASHERIRAVDARRGALLDALLDAADAAAVAAVATEFSTTFAPHYTPVVAGGGEAALRVDAAVAAAGPAALAGFRNGHLVVLTAGGPDEVGAVAAAIGDGAAVVCGEPVPPGAELLAEYHHVEQLLGLVQHHRRAGVHGPDDLILEQLLAGAPRAAAALAARIAALREHDRSRAIEDTLRAWLGSGSIPATATSVAVHANTVSYRLRRVAELTGLDPKLPEHATLLQLGLVSAEAVHSPT